MFSNGSKPVQHSSQAHEAEKRDVKLFITRSDSWQPFDSLKEILHAMPPSVVASMVCGRFESAESKWDARLAARSEDAFVKAVAIISLIGDHSLVLRKDVPLPRSCRCVVRVPAPVAGRVLWRQPCRHLAVDSSLGAPKILILLLSGEIGRVLRNLHMGGIQMPLSPFSALSEGI